MGDIWGIILAAGESRRMGSPKLLLPFGGMIILERVIFNVRKSNADNIIVVLGGHIEKLKAVVEKSSVNYCYNENFKEGMLSSVQCGFRNLPLKIGAAIVIQGDQPMISHEVINSLIEAYRVSGKGIIIPVFNNRRGHPLLIADKYRDEIERLDPEIGLRSLALRFSEDVMEVNTKEPVILRDIDTYQDYLNEINQID